MRVFFAHPKRMSDEETDRLTRAVQTVFSDDGIRAIVIPGRDDYMTYGPSAGTFQAWAVDVVTRVNPDRSPFYDAIVVPGRVIGSATRIIVQGALAQKIPVLVVEQNDNDNGMPIEFSPVREVITENDQDYASGWWLDT